MKTSNRISIVIILAAFLFACSPAQQGESPEAMVAGAKALDEQFVTAFNSGDVDAVMACYWNSPDLINYPPDQMQVRGFDNVKQGFMQMTEHMKGATMQMTDMDYIVAGDKVIGHGMWKMSIPDGSGGMMDVEGRYTDVKMNKDGKWVFIMDHASAPMPPPPADIMKMHGDSTAATM